MLGAFDGRREANRLGSMRRGDGEFGDLRLAAGATDRQQAARWQWPAFEVRLRDLGYSPSAIAHAFCSLSGPGTVAEALAVLERTQRASRAVARNFEIREPPGNYSTGQGLRIASVERDANEIRIGYDLGVTALLGIGAAFAADRPRCKAKDDLEASTASSAAVSSGSPPAMTRAAPSRSPAADSRCRYLILRRPNCASASRATRPSHRSGRRRRAKPSSRSGNNRTGPRHRSAAWAACDPVSSDQIGRGYSGQRLPTPGSPASSGQRWVTRTLS